MKLFIIWNIKENRPALIEHSYAPILCFLTEEQAQAYEGSSKALGIDRKDFMIKEGELTVK